MPLMTRPESGQLRIIPDRSRSSYIRRGWKPAGRRGRDAVERPNVSDLKSDWVAYAKSQGVATSGMTKDEIIDAVGS